MVDVTQEAGPVAQPLNWPLHQYPLGDSVSLHACQISLCTYSTLMEVGRENQEHRCLQLEEFLVSVCETENSLVHL